MLTSLAALLISAKAGGGAGARNGAAADLAMPEKSGADIGIDVTMNRTEKS